jgi:hypothetical protein
LLERAQPLRLRIQKWRETLPSLSKGVSELSDEDLDDCADLRMSHITLEILIYRALLRPLAYRSLVPGDEQQEPVSTIFDNCHGCATVATAFVNSLKARHFAGFWSPCKSTRRNCQEPSDQNKGYAKPHCPKQYSQLTSHRCPLSVELYFCLHPDQFRAVANERRCGPEQGLAG